MKTRRPTLRIVQIIAVLVALTGVLKAQSSNELTLADAQRIIAAAEKTATGMSLRVSIAIVNSRGDLIAVERMPGAAAATPDTAIGKAMSAAIYLQPSAALVARATAPTTQGLNEATGGRLRFVQGGVPIVRNGETVGAVAASGATSQQDEDIAKSGLVAAF